VKGESEMRVNEILKTEQEPERESFFSTISLGEGCVVVEE
jgi:hypothetical protein